MIVARTRVSDMSNVKKLNCWGAELTDVSVLRKLVNVEVLSLSVNCITTLADIQNCKNLQELYIRKNKIPDLNEVCWLRELTKLKNLWLEENPCCNQTQSELYRSTVIRNLPQLQKLDNVVVQPDEVADAMRRGIELIHPYDTDETIPYTNYAQPPGGPQSYQQTPMSTPIAPPPSAMSTSRRASSQIIEYQTEENRRASNCQYDQQYSCPSRRVSNQVFDPPLGPTPTQSEGASSDSLGSQAGYMVRTPGSVNYAIEDGYVPDYHTGRRLSSQSEQHGPVRRSPRMSQASIDESLRRMSIQESGTYEDERNANSYNGGSRSNSIQHQESYRDPPRNAYARSNMSYEDGDPRSIVASHYEQTYEQVDQQIGSARQLLEERRLRSQQTPERPYPRRPKNRNSNILSAVLCLVKELDAPSLEVAEMAIRCRMEELDD